MNGDLRDVLERLRRDATCARHQHAFAAGRQAQPALTDHPDAASVLAALDNEAKDSYPVRDALIKALIAEHRASGAAIWALLLLGGFKPMLVRLRSRLFADTVPGDELDQLVVTSFLMALIEVPLTDRVPMRLRQRTERLVFAFLRKERQQHHRTVGVEALESLHVDNLCPQRERTQDQRKALGHILQHADQHGLSTSGLDVVEATVLGQELLRAYVERLAPDDEVARERLYQRLKRQRSRAIQRLRALLAAMSPNQDSIGL